MKKRILTGIKPTGFAHLGNYFGAIRPAINLSQSGEFEYFYFIADNHALTTLKSAEEMKEYTYNIACTWLACGLDPEKVVFYRQTDVPEIFHLSWILSNVTPKGLMNRAHAYKAKVEENVANGVDIDSGVNMGLYNYPILMAADILLFESNLVPVGLDQKQHIEIARDIAESFNKKYGQTFVMPEEYLEKDTCTIVGLDGRKMSKSYNNQIQLFTDEKTLQKSINKIVTDSRLPGEAKDPDCTLAVLYKIFASQEEYANYIVNLKAGMGWGEAKKELFRVVNAKIAPMREKFNYYMSHKQEVDEILNRGAEKARKVALQTYQKVLKNIGVK